MPLPGFFKGL